MFGLKIIHKRELALFNAVITDLRERIAKMEQTVEAERKRADAAINALLIRTQKLALTPTKTYNPDEEEQIKRHMLDIFNESDEEQGGDKREDAITQSQKKILENLQNGK